MSIVVIQQILFAIALIITGFFAYKRVKFIARNISLGKKHDLSDNKSERLKKMLLIAFGQKKMFKKPIPAFLHLLIYAGFLIINIEVLEIVIDGLFGTHRVFQPIFGDLYNVFISIFELLALGVLLSCVAFLYRRNIQKVKRFWGYEMKGWPRLDANLILIFEIILMTALITWNASDQALQQLMTQAELNDNRYVNTDTFLLSGMFVPFFAENFSEGALRFMERFAWWIHILGIFGFGIYVTYSKHLHIALAFPNTYYTRLTPQAELRNMPEITQEIKLMMNPDAAADIPADAPPPGKFGAKDATDLTWKNLMDAYSCTECGRCTAACPANNTGKLLSPRKIMMDTRDRIEEIGRNIDTHGVGHEDGKSLLRDYITEEELRACTTCQACVEECPVSINPLDIIYQLRRYMIMEEANSPQEWNLMFTNVENNAAPWQFSPSDRLKWADEIRNAKID